MELCDGKSAVGGHEEIIYDSGPCPLCLLKNALLDLEDRVKDLENILEAKELDGM